MYQFVLHGILYRGPSLQVLVTYGSTKTGNGVAALT
jgi:hypothetical protein